MMSIDAPALSVIIPTYNRAAMVRECVRSLQECGLEALEIVVVDDGSTDDTERVIRSLGEAVSYLRQENAGPAAARNRGFQHSKGRYVAFLDSDDTWEAGVPGHVVGLLDRYPNVDIVFADARMGNDQEGFISWIERAGEEAFKQLPCTAPEPGFRVFERKPFFRRMARRNPVFIGAVVMRRQAFVQAGMFDTELCGAADWELWLRMASRMTFGFCSEALAVYTRHLDCMSNNHDSMWHEFCLSLRKILHKCDWLEGPERDWVEKQLDFDLFSYAYMAYERGDYWEARRRFRDRLVRPRRDLWSTFYWALCGLPPSVVKSVRTLKRCAGL